jgi:hypothetical protein
MEIGSGTWCGTEEGVYFSKYANQRGAKSARRVSRRLLALLAPPHLRVFEKHTTARLRWSVLDEAPSSMAY